MHHTPRSLPMHEAVMVAITPTEFYALIQSIKLEATKADVYRCVAEVLAARGLIPAPARRHIMVFS